MAENSVILNGKPFVVVDGDTVADTEGNRYRLDGINARETSKIIEDDEGLRYKRGYVGAEAQKQALIDAINDGGYDTMELLGRRDNSKGNREIVELKNKNNSKISNKLVASGIVEVDTNTTAEAIKLKRANALFNAVYGYEKNPNLLPRQDVRDAMDSRGLAFKTKAINEEYFNPEINSDVQFRRNDRTLDNKAVGIGNQAAVSWGVGWDGIKEGLWGYADAVGQTTGFEMLENLGEAGTRRARSEAMLAPNTLMDYEDVDSVMDGFSYVLNNAAASAPYMITTFAAMAAAGPIAGLTGATSLAAGATLNSARLIAGVTRAMVKGSPSLIYAGQAWNEMEGDKGIAQFVSASVTGVAISALERLGLSGLMSPTTLLSSGGVRAVATAYRNKLGKDKITIAEAVKHVARVTRSEQGQLAKQLAVRLDPTKLARFSGTQLGRAAILGMLKEGGTELIQEGLQVANAALMSDKTYTAKELKNRFMNAGIAGGVLGTGFSSAGNIHQQTKNRLMKTDLVQNQMERQRIIEQARIQDATLLQQEGRKINSVKQNIKEFDNTDINIIKQEGINEDKIIVYDPAGKPIIATVIKTSEKGGKIIKLEDGSEHILNNSAYYDQSIYDGVDIGFNTGDTNQTLNSRDFTKEQIESLLPQLESQIKSFEDQGATNQLTYLDLRLKTNALKIKLKVLNGQTVIKPKNPDIVQQKEIKLNYTEGGNTVDPVTNKERSNSSIVSRMSDRYKDTKKGVRNFFKNNDDLFDYVESMAKGVGRLVKASEAVAVDMNKLVLSKTGLDIFARVGQVTTGVYHAGMNFKQYHDQLLQDYKSGVDENDIAQTFGYKNITTGNVGYITEQLRAFGAANGFLLVQKYRKLMEKDSTKKEIYLEEIKRKLVAKGFDLNIDLTQEKLLRINLGARSLQYSYERMQASIDEAMDKEDSSQRRNKRKKPTVKPNYWWRNRGFDWRKVKDNPKNFKTWYKNTTNSSDKQAQEMYDSVVKRNTSNDQGQYSLLDQKFTPYALSDRSDMVAGSFGTKKGIDDWSSNNIFESLHNSQNEVAKYVSTTYYFGEGGSKLNKLFYQLEQEQLGENGAKDWTQDDIDQFAYYVKSIIDSTHGNFNRISDPRWAAVNRFLTSWSIFAGLSLSTISSIPETAMIYFNVKDDVEWQQATSRLMEQMTNSWTKATTDEYEKTKRMTKQSGLGDDMNTVVDRYATGDRDVAFLKVHETFFRLIGIKQFTQFQRRMNAGFAVDFIKSGLKNLEVAPQDDAGNFKFSEMNELEMRTYNQLADLGMDVDFLYKQYMEVAEALRDPLFDITDNHMVMDEGVRELSNRELAAISLIEKRNKTNQSEAELAKRTEQLIKEINEQIQTGIYRFVNERIQNPQAANRPLWFQDPHYQLLTQFNGFISTFTANVVPKLWNNQLRKGTAKVKYDTFTLVLIMIAMGGASQYLKDLLKFGKPSPYLDNIGYAQRALYSSGVIGQFERAIDIAAPLYPQRADSGIQSVLNLVLGEAGPSLRNISNIASGAGNLIAGDTERGLGDVFRATPVVAPITAFRKGAVDIAHLRNPVRDVSLPNKRDIIDMILPN